jgi:NAD(P)-dependent dehydrogenase (short-subunit alcohol dehydrogenase family)
MPVRRRSTPYRWLPARVLRISVEQSVGGLLRQGNMDLTELTQLYDFTGKTVMVTGGAGILGGEIACALVGCCANVAILDRDPALADRLIQRLDAGPGRALIVYGDVLSRDTLVEAEQAVREAFGAVDILINAAGGNKPQATTGLEQSFFDLPEDALRFVFDLNILGTFLPCQAFGRRMAEQGEGVILNISSMNALRPLTRIPAYSAAKAGVSNFTQWLAVHMAQEYSPRIRVNAIAPGFFLTEQNRYLLTEKTTGELSPRGRVIIEHTPMGRFGDPEELLGAVLWLLSPASAFVTGIVVPVDGGFSAFSGV